MQAAAIAAEETLLTRLAKSMRPVRASTHCPTVTTDIQRFCDDTDLVTNLVTNKKALVSEGFDDKQVLDFVGCGGKI
jgi:hypothetical protein